MLRAACAMVAAIVAGCGGGSDGPGSYVGRTQNAVVFVQWTRDGSAVSGTLRQALLSEDQAQVRESSAAITGTVQDGALTLQVGGQLLGSAISGRFKGDELELDYPGVDGGVVEIKLSSDDAAGYNSQLGALRASAQQTKREQDVQAAQATATQRARGALQAKASAVVGDLGFRPQVRVGQR